MSTQRKREPLPDTIREEAVQDFLRDHPEFFERHPRLLDAMRVPHSTGGGAVSLVERQVATLRQRNRKLERKLRELLDVARTNDRLASRIHELSLALIPAGDRTETLKRIAMTLTTGFGADHAVMVLFGDPAEFEDAGERRFLHVIQRDDPRLGPFETFLAAGRARCGRVRDSQREFLYGISADEVGSMALLPLGERAELGFIGIGSVDADHFHPGMSIDFLTRIGELVAAALRRP
jgi:uncharacterized protein YigA (DUF484 family)